MNENSFSNWKLTLMGREICKQKNPFNIALNQRHPFDIKELPIDFWNNVVFYTNAGIYDDSFFHWPIFHDFFPFHWSIFTIVFFFDPSFTIVFFLFTDPSFMIVFFTGPSSWLFFFSFHWSIFYDCFFYTDPSFTIVIFIFTDPSFTIVFFHWPIFHDFFFFSLILWLFFLTAHLSQLFFSFHWSIFCDCFFFTDPYLGMGKLYIFSLAEWSVGYHPGVCMLV